MTTQFAICRLRGPAVGSQPVVVLQHDHVTDIPTRIVAPLIVEGKMKRLTRLHPVVIHEGQRMIVAVDLAAAVPANLIGPMEGSAEHLQDEIKAALDLLFLGF